VPEPKGSSSSKSSALQPFLLAVVLTWTGVWIVVGLTGFFMLRINSHGPSIWDSDNGRLFLSAFKANYVPESVLDGIFKALLAALLGLVYGLGTYRSLMNAPRHALWPKDGAQTVGAGGTVDGLFATFFLGLVFGAFRGWLAGVALPGALLGAGGGFFAGITSLLTGADIIEKHRFGKVR
jgi:hypothetical protein